MSDLNNQIINKMPTEIFKLLESNNLHKLASLRAGTVDFGLDTAVAHLGKKAYYQRHVNKAIANGINSLTSFER